jgi:hypothetical protein
LNDNAVLSSNQARIYFCNLQGSQAGLINIYPI